MNASDQDTQNIALISWAWINQSSTQTTSVCSAKPAKPDFDLLHPLRQWLEKIEVQNADFAHSICKLIPAQCPFERDIKFLGHTLFHIPPLCKLNPVYDQVVALRFRALCYLADVCGEDVSRYC
jgi:hypothetical protein